MNAHPLQAARAEQEESKLNRSLGLLIRQAIIDACKTRGTCHADDIEGLYPERHHSRCRKLAPAQFGSLSSLKLIEQVEYRKSVVPERKGSKSWSWKFTKAGWDRYGTAVGIGTDNRTEPYRQASGDGASTPVSADSGGSNPVSGAPKAQAEGGPSSPRSSASVDSPDQLFGSAAYQHMQDIEAA